MTAYSDRSARRSEALCRERDAGSVTFYRSSEVTGAVVADEDVGSTSDPVELRVVATPALAPGKSVPARLLVTLPADGTCRTVESSKVSADGDLVLSLDGLPESITTGQTLDLASEADWSSSISSEAPVTHERRARVGMASSLRGIQYVPRHFLALIPRSGDEMLRPTGTRCKVQEVDEGPTVAVYWS